MDRLPEVFKGISGLELAPGNQEWFDRTPYFLSLPPDLSQKKPSVADVHVVSPCAQLHGKELLWPQGSNQESGPVQQHFARKKALEVALRAVVEPVLWKIEGAGHSACSLPQTSGTPGPGRADVDITRCLAGVVQQDESSALKLALHQRQRTDSGVCVRRVSARPEAGRIIVRFDKCICGPGSTLPYKYELEAHMTRPSPGKYVVVYDDADAGYPRIGEVELGE
jgi:hypothetical protein